MERFVAHGLVRLCWLRAAIAARDESEPGFSHTDEPWLELTALEAERRKLLASEVVQLIGTSTGIELRTYRGSGQPCSRSRMNSREEGPAVLTLFPWPKKKSN